MSPEQAAFCVKYPDHPKTRELMQRDWDMMLLDPVNKEAFDQAVRRFSDAVDEECVRQVYREVHGESR